MLLFVDNNCHIWDGDAYKNYWNKQPEYWKDENGEIWHRYSQEEFINKIKTDDEFAKKWGELGPVYGKQWRRWIHHYPKTYPEVSQYEQYIGVKTIDQIANLINDLKTNPDSRRLIVSAWNVGELDQMVLPPCHYGFIVKLTGSQEFNPSQYIQPQFKYYSVDTNTIYPPCLEFRWRDLYDHGFIDPEGFGTNYTFINNIHYVKSDINTPPKEDA